MKRIALFATAVCGLAATSAVLADGMTMRKKAAENGAIIRNVSSYAHGADTNVNFNSVNLAAAPVIVASETTYTDALNETGGFFADGDTAVIWNPGDGANAASDPPKAFLYILDEDKWLDADGDPYDNGAIKAYVAEDGMWTMSDQNAKSNITRLTGATAVLQGLNGYSYEFIRGDEELQKGAYGRPGVTGVLAQELQQVLPAAVSSNANGEMWVNYSQITPVLIEAIKEQQALIDELRERLDLLDGGGAPTQ